MSAQVLLEVRIPGHWPLQRQHLLASARAEGDAVGTRGGLHRPKPAGVIRVSVVIAQAGRALFLDQRAARREQLHRAVDDLMHRRLQRLIGRRASSPPRPWTPMRRWQVRRPLHHPSLPRMLAGPVARTGRQDIAATAVERSSVARIQIGVAKVG